MSDTQKLRLFSHSRLDTFRACMRKGYYSYFRQWALSGAAVAPTWGSSWHCSMDVVWRNHAATGKARSLVIEEAYQAFITEWTKSGFSHPDDMSPDDIDNLGAKTPQIAQEMLFSYFEAREHIFLDPSFKLLDIERPFAVPLDPNDPTLFYVGKLDKVFEYQGRVRVGEHKSTGSYKVNGPFRQDYIDSFAPNSQVDGYLYALHKLCQEGAYGDHNKTKAGGIWIDAALTHKKIHDGFMIIPIERRMEHLDEWLWTTMTWVDMIEGNIAAAKERSSLDTPYMAAFPQNTNSCSNFGGCGYRDFCRSYPNPAKVKEIPLGYVKKTSSSIFDQLKFEKLGFKIEQIAED